MKIRNEDSNKARDGSHEVEDLDHAITATLRVRNAWMALRELD
jgi:hypothetical protein